MNQSSYMVFGKEVRKNERRRHKVQRNGRDGKGKKVEGGLKCMKEIAKMVDRQAEVR